jgi:Ni/Co efflux regulator RcnB
MKKIVLAVVATALSTGATVAFSQAARADSIYDHRPEYSREDYRYHHWEDHRREEHPYYSRREYYPQGYYDGRYYPRRDSHFQVIVPLIIR